MLLQRLKWLYSFILLHLINILHYCTDPILTVNIVVQLNNGKVVMVDATGTSTSLLLKLTSEIETCDPAEQLLWRVTVRFPLPFKKLQTARTNKAIIEKSETLNVAY